MALVAPVGWKCSFGIMNGRQEMFYWAINSKGVKVGESTWEKPPEVPPGWKAACGKNNGRLQFYYWAVDVKGAQNGESTWEKPPEVPLGWKAACGKKNGRLQFYYWAVDGKGAQNGESTWEKPPQVPLGWKAACGKNNGRLQFYYWAVDENGVRRGQTTWERPTTVSMTNFPAHSFQPPARTAKILSSNFSNSQVRNYNLLRPLRNTKTAVLYHATRDSVARAIMEQRHFLAGHRGFLGPGIYFSADPNNAKRWCQCRSGHGPIVVVRCEVNLGSVATVGRGNHTAWGLRNSGCDSYKEAGRDCYMIPNDDHTQILPVRIEH